MSNANLQGALFLRRTLIGANLNAADLRGAQGFSGSGESMVNTIGVNGTIQGLNLNAANPLLVIRQNTGQTLIPVTISGQMTIASSGTLQILFDGPTTGWMISFAPSTSVSLGGTLELGLAPGTDPTTLFGQGLAVLRWPSSYPPGQFNVVERPPRHLLLEHCLPVQRGRLPRRGPSRGELGARQRQQPNRDRGG